MGCVAFSFVLPFLKGNWLPFNHPDACGVCPPLVWPFGSGESFSDDKTGRAMAWWKTRKGLQVTYGAATHIGQVRSENQDSYGRFPVTGTAADEDQLFIVADGMGGHAR